MRKIWRQSNYAKWGKTEKGAKVFSRHLVMGSIPDYRDKCFVLLYTPERRSRRRISLTKMPCCSEQHGGWVVKKGVWSRVWTRIIKKLTKKLLGLRPGSLGSVPNEHLTRINFTLQEVSFGQVHYDNVHLQVHQNFFPLSRSGFHPNVWNNFWKFTIKWAFCALRLSCR